MSRGSEVALLILGDSEVQTQLRDALKFAGSRLADIVRPLFEVEEYSLSRENEIAILEVMFGISQSIKPSDWQDIKLSDPKKPLPRNTFYDKQLNALRACKSAGELEAYLASTVAKAQSDFIKRLHDTSSFKHQMQKLNKVKWPVLFVGVIAAGLLAYNYYVKNVNTLTLVLSSVFLFLGPIMGARAAGKFDEEHGYCEKMMQAKLPIVCFSAMDVASAVILLPDSSLGNKALLGGYFALCSFKGILTRQLIEGGDYRHRFTKKQQKRRRTYLAQFSLMFVPMVCAALYALYQSDDKNKMTLVISTGASLLLRMGYEFMTARAMKASFKLRFKNMLGEMIYMASMTLIMSALFHFDGSLSFKASDWFMALCSSSSAAYEAFSAPVVSPTIAHSQQLSRCGRLKKDDAVPDKTSRCCCCSGLGPRQLDLLDSDNELDDRFNFKQAGHG